MTTRYHSRTDDTRLEQAVVNPDLELEFSPNVEDASSVRQESSLNTELPNSSSLAEVTAVWNQEVDDEESRGHPRPHSNQESSEPLTSGPDMHRNLNLLVLSFLFFLAAGAIGVVTAFLLTVTEPRQDGGAVAPPIPSPTTRGDESSQDDRFAAIVNLLASRGLASPSAFLDSTAPQYRAVNWLIYEDETKFLVNLEEGGTSEQQVERFLQRYVLMLFAFSTGVDLWNVVDPWTTLTRSDACSFFGVQCNLKGEVTALTMPLFRLSGTIPSQLGKVLTKLTSLTLNENMLEGSIPESIYELSDLEQFNVFSNQLGSTISTRIGQLTNLKHLLLSQNEFIGTLPTSSMTQLSNLEIFHFANNLGSVAAPDIFDAVLSWPNLAGMDLTRLTGYEGVRLPSDIQNLSALTYLVVDGMHPQIPTEIGNLSNLVILYFFNPRLPLMMSEEDQVNDFIEENWSTTNATTNVTNDDSILVPSTSTSTSSGTIPSEIGKLGNLRDLSISGRHLIRGTIPTEMGLLRNLEFLILAPNNLSGTIPSEMGLLPKLSRLSLAGNPSLGGTIPQEWGFLAHEIINLALQSTAIEGTFPASFCGFDRIDMFLDCERLTCSCCSRVVCST